MPTAYASRGGNASPKTIRISIAELGSEPFRVMFPAGVLAGITGVALWPLHFLGWIDLYPGQNHARLMTCGLFGAFIFGFLGTSLPKLLSVAPLRLWQTTLLLLLQLTLTLAFATSRAFAGEAIFLLMLVLFVSFLAARLTRRKDNPPPGFVLVAMAMTCATAAQALAVTSQFVEMESHWITLQRLLSTQGFVLLPVLGIGPFLLPRFLGQKSTHEFPESLALTSIWKRKALQAAAAGGLIIASFFLEAFGWQRVAYALRFAVTLGYFLLEVPFHLGPKLSSASGFWIRASMTLICAGLLAVALVPTYRVALLHLTLVGGFAVMTFVVASRVVFGHSGRFDLLRRNRWLVVSMSFMIFGMATRISGDFWPRILPTHYSYGALLWMIGVGLWSYHVLPKILVTEDES